MKRLLLGFFLLSIVSFAAHAQPLTLQKAINLALKNAPNQRVSQDKIYLSESKLQQAHDLQLPYSKVSASWSQFNLASPFELTLPGSADPAFGIGKGAFDATMGSASVAEELFGGFRIRNSIKSANYLLQSSRLESRADSQMLAFNITSAYYTIYKILKSQELLAQNVKVLTEKQREIASLEKSGMATHNDILRIQLQMSNIELAQKEAANAYNVALYTMSIYLGLDNQSQPFIIDTTGLIGNLATPSGMESFSSSALTNRAELLAANWQIKAAETGLDLLKSNRYPHVSVSAGYNYIYPGLALIPEKNSFINAWNVGVNISYNISSLYADKGKMQEAQYQTNLLKDGRQAKENQIKTEVFKDYNDWILAKEKILVAEKAITQGEENYRVMESWYRNNISSLSDLLEANTLLLQARMNKMNAEADAQLAHDRLLFASGQWVLNK